MRSTPNERDLDLFRQAVRTVLAAQGSAEGLEIDLAERVRAFLKNADPSVASASDNGAVQDIDGTVAEAASARRAMA